MIYLIYNFGKFRGCERWLEGFSLAHHESEGEKQWKKCAWMRNLTSQWKFCKAQDILNDV